MLLKGTERIKVDFKGWAEEGREGGDNLSSINPIPWARGQYVPDIRITINYRCLNFNIQSRFSRE